MPTFLDEGRLDVLAFFSKITMKGNHVVVLEPPLPCNLVIGLGPKLHLVASCITNFQSILH
jgi:hypothetical protein